MSANQSGANIEVLLIGNYDADQQESMQRYARMLEQGLTAAGHRVQLIKPELFFGRLKSRLFGIGKWLGYVDKFLIFPFRLRREARRIPGRVVHICDHSNAMYTAQLAGVPHVVTCHDVLAIRSALGHFPENRTGWTGRRLQAWILRGLRRARQVICVSGATRSQMLGLGGFEPARSSVVYNPLNYPYQPMRDADAERELTKIPSVLNLGCRGFIFHIGGNQWYKNREGVLRIYFQYVEQGGRLPLVMAGKSFTSEMKALMAQAPRAARVIEAGAVDNGTLNALYARAACLLFPSLEEGFGWPVLEALAVGTQVVATGHAPMSEIGGDAVVGIDPTDETASGRRLVAMLGETAEHRREREARGLERARAFATGVLMEKYLSAYAQLSRPSA